MIGNSFSVDAANYTHDISLGSDVNIEVCVLYVGGCSLEQHINFISNNEAPYEWFINGVSTGRYISLKEALSYKEYDFITLQQVSVLSGRKDTFYPYIKDLMNYVKQHQEDPHFVLHETWAYENGFDNENFSFYKYDRENMYICIRNTYEELANELGIDITIRSGDVVEAAINHFCEHFHKDGFHLNNEGRYLSALTFVRTFDKKPLKTVYVPNEDIFSDRLCKDYEDFVLEVLK